MVALREHALRRIPVSLFFLAPYYILPQVVINARWDSVGLWWGDWAVVRLVIETSVYCILRIRFPVLDLYPNYLGSLEVSGVDLGLFFSSFFSFIWYIIAEIH